MIAAVFPALYDDVADASGSGTEDNPYAYVSPGAMLPDRTYILVGIELEEVRIVYDCSLRDLAYPQDMGLTVDTIARGLSVIDGTVSKAGTFTLTGVMYDETTGETLGNLSYTLYFVMGPYLSGQNYSTEEQPYTGLYMHAMSPFSGTLYLLQGSPVEITFDASDIELTEGDASGLAIEGNVVTGTADGTGTVTFYEDGMGSEVSFVIVQASMELEFLSDPADGILIPPNHHLVTFVYIDGITVYRVVEHGEYLEDVPATEYLWYSSGHGFADVPIQITSDVVYHEQYSGGGSQIG